MRGRRDQRGRGWLLATVATLVAATVAIAGCATGDVSAPPTVSQSPDAVTPSPTANRPAGTGTGTILLAAGDIGRCDSTHDDSTGALVAGLAGVIATLGDTAYEDGSTEELADCFGGAWGPVKDRIRFAATGNHDIHTDGGEPLRDYMGSAASRDGRTWFSDQLGAWHVVVLDGNCGLFGRRCNSGSEQTQWLRDDLAASTAICTLALMHQPRFSSGHEHGNDRAVGPLWDALYAAGAELVLAGHDHDYERFAPQDPDGTADAARGITQFVVGTGGAELEPFGDVKANSLVRRDDVYGVVELTLEPDSWSFRFVGVDGSTHDQGGGTCH